MKSLQKEHGEQLSLLIKNVGRLSDILPLSFISKHISAGNLDINALAEWDKLTRISMSALNKRQQEMAFSAVSGLISEHSEFFSTFTAATLLSNHEEAAAQSANALRASLMQASCSRRSPHGCNGLLWDC
ncbi:hypothetical protein GJV14_13235 [Enterobacteriaceae bacterium RIT697]|nr:hypothetical protein [Enterobacteriaceae bacterium RIT697]